MPLLLLVLLLRLLLRLRLRLHLLPLLPRLPLLPLPSLSSSFLSSSGEFVPFFTPALVQQAKTLHASLPFPPIHLVSAYFHHTASMSHCYILSHAECNFLLSPPSASSIRSRGNLASSLHINMISPIKIYRKGARNILPTICS